MTDEPRDIEDEALLEQIAVETAKLSETNIAVVQLQEKIDGLRNQAMVQLGRVQMLQEMREKKEAPFLGGGTLTVVDVATDETERCTAVFEDGGVEEAVRCVLQVVDGRHPGQHHDGEGHHWDD